MRSLSTLPEISPNAREGPAEVAREELGGSAARELFERGSQADAGLCQIVGVPDVDRDLLLADGRLDALRKACHLREQPLESAAVEGADGDGREAGRGHGRRMVAVPEEVGLVEHDDRI